MVCLPKKRLRPKAKIVRDRLMALDPALQDQLQSVFFDESEDGLAVIEAGLLELSRGSRDPELINGIFRAVHSIKGGGGTFGMTVLVEFSHRLETLLDRIRAKEHAIDAPTLDLLLRAVDALGALLQAKRARSALDHTTLEQLSEELNASLVRSAPVADLPAIAIKPDSWLIHYAPDFWALETRNDPLIFLAELQRLGHLEVTLEASRLPSFAELNPIEIYLAWDIVLTEAPDEEAIQDVLAWVEDGSVTIRTKPPAQKPIDAQDTQDAHLEDARLEQNTHPEQDAQPERQDVRLEQNTRPEHEAQEKPFDTRPSGLPPLPDERVPIQLGVLKKSVEALGRSRVDGSIRVATSRIDDLVNLVGELVIIHSMLSDISQSPSKNREDRLRAGLGELGRNTLILQESVMRMRMLPIQFALTRLPRLVHDLSIRLKKRIRLEILGETTELDKIVMEGISDPLLHLVRNAIDHGVESPAERLAAGKPEEGLLRIQADQQGGYILIRVTDDGRGIDEAHLLEKAVAAGLVDPMATLNRAQIQDLVFHPGLSTREEVSDLSGRGVGLDVVRRNVRELGGNVRVESEPGRGTRFEIRLPLTLAIIEGKLVRIEDQKYVIPLAVTVETLRIEKERLSRVASGHEFYRLGTEMIPVLRVYELFGLPSTKRDLDNLLLTVVDAGGRQVGLLVDELLGHQQVVVKSLEANYKPILGISGATILGNGRVALILDVAGIVDLAFKGQPPRVKYLVQEPSA